MTRKSRIPDCHPEKKHEAKGMCVNCYMKHRASLPEVIERNKDPERIARSREIKMRYWKSEKGQNKHKEYYSSEQGEKVRKEKNRRDREQGRYKTDRYKALSKVRKIKYRQRKGKLKDREYKKSQAYKDYLSTPEYKLIAKKNSAFRKKKQRIASLGKGFRMEMREIYGNCPDGFHVDHIIPLINDHVSGLNVPWNLQYLDPASNIKKYNSFDFTYHNNGWKFEFFK